MLIYGIIFPRWHAVADVSLGNWKIFRRFLPSLFRRITVSAGIKCYTAPAFTLLLFLFLSLISFKSPFGHSSFFASLAFCKKIRYDTMVEIRLKGEGFPCTRTD